MAKLIDRPPDQNEHVCVKRTAAENARGLLEGMYVETFTSAGLTKLHEGHPRNRLSAAAEH
jgi:hypothetical protein